MSAVHRCVCGLRRRARGLALLTLAGLALGLLYLLASNQVGVVAYKVGLVAAGLIIGLAADMLAFPYAAPDGYLDLDWHEGKHGPDGNESCEYRADYPVAVGCEKLFVAAQLRRAALVIVSILAVCLGL